MMSNEATLRQPNDLVLSVDGLTKTFVTRRGLLGRPFRTQALRGVSMQLRRREIVGVVGESGSGKSTLGRCIVGLEQPERGRIVLNDRVLNDGSRQIVGAADRKIGFIFQDPYSSLNPRLQVTDIVGEALQIAGGLPAAEIQDRVDEALTLVGLRPEDGKRHVHQFSGGQRQRVGIARAIALNPALLIADEAVSSLDVSVQMQILNVLLDLRDKLSLSIVFITHNIGVVEYLCDTMVVMTRGQVVESGATRDVIFSARHDYTRRLIAAVPRI